MQKDKKNRFIILDTETTGLSIINNDRIIEIGCVEIIDQSVTGNNFQKYINPEKILSKEVINIHKITNDFLADKPKFNEIAEDFISYIIPNDYDKYNNFIVAHNASFDMKFINFEFSKLQKNNTFNNFTIIDTLPIGKKFMNGKPANLDALCNEFQINLDNRTKLGHGALLDAKLLSEIFIIFHQKGLINSIVNKNKKFFTKLEQPLIPRPHPEYFE